MQCNLYPKISALVSTLHFILSHPLNRHRKFCAIRRYVAWQIGSRIVPGPVAVRFVNDAMLLVKPGMLGATRNIYGGLEEFEEMSFLLHVLRRTDLFVDVGANIGVYTVLASAAGGARSIAFEPAPPVFDHLRANIALNDIGQRAILKNVVIGAKPCRVRFTKDLDVMNHVVASGQPSPIGSINVPVETLDIALSGEDPALIKIDVEGYETEVIAGAAATLDGNSLFAVIMELNNSGERYGFDQRELYRVMCERGFTPFAYNPFDRVLIPVVAEDRRSRNIIFVRFIDHVLDRLKSAAPFQVNGIRI